MQRYRLNSKTYSNSVYEDIIKLFTDAEYHVSIKNKQTNRVVPNKSLNKSLNKHADIYVLFTANRKTNKIPRTNLPIKSSKKEDNPLKQLDDGIVFKDYNTQIEYDSEESDGTIFKDYDTKIEYDSDQSDGVVFKDYNIHDESHLYHGDGIQDTRKKKPRASSTSKSHARSKSKALQDGSLAPKRTSSRVTSRSAPKNKQRKKLPYELSDGDLHNDCDSEISSASANFQANIVCKNGQCVSGKKKSIQMRKGNKSIGKTSVEICKNGKCMTQEVLHKPKEIDNSNYKVIKLTVHPKSSESYSYDLKKNNDSRSTRNTNSNTNSSSRSPKKKSSSRKSLSDDLDLSDGNIKPRVHYYSHDGNSYENMDGMYNDY